MGTSGWIRSNSGSDEVTAVADGFLCGRERERKVKESQGRRRKREEGEMRQGGGKFELAALPSSLRVEVAACASASPGGARCRHRWEERQAGIEPRWALDRRERTTRGVT